MKLLAIILAVLLVSFTSEPLVSEIVAVEINVASDQHKCCCDSDNCSCDDSCGSKEHPNCSGKCHNEYHTSTSYTISVVGETLEVVNFVKPLTACQPLYTFNFPSFIWHPPKISDLISQRSRKG